MTEPRNAALRKIVLNAARSKAFPEGSIRHGYDFIAPLTADGHIDLDVWKKTRGQCFAHRFWGDELPLRGLLVHRAGGRGGSTWAFEWTGGGAADEDEGFRFADHAFRPGEYVSLREEEGELVTFRVITVGARDAATLMARRAGSADLPLHGGRVPQWLADRMTKLGATIAEAIVIEYGRDEFLRRLAHPFWFQSFGAVMGMDWHSSGVTTSVIGALKRGLAPLSGELGLHVCGGRGAHSRRTPQELAAIGERVGFDGEKLATASRLVAKVDSAAVQDGFDLYLHGFIVADDGRWVVVQQGMNGERKQARRYHWLSEGLSSFVEAPHAAIDGPDQGVIINLTDVRAESSRRRQIDLLADLGPDGITRRLAQIEPAAHKRIDDAQPLLPHLVMPAHHDVRAEDIVTRRLHANLAAATNRAPHDFAELLLTPGVGARTVRALAQVAEVVHGAPYRFSDPARFSVAHGGKDRHPYPVPLKVYDRTIAVMKAAVMKAKLGESEALAAIKRLDVEARRLEAAASGPSTEALFAEERARSHAYGGHSVFGPEPAPDARQTLRR